LVQMQAAPISPDGVVSLANCPVSKLWRTGRLIS
jgi:hypothetical protein